jgi:hypothetical protein
LVSLYQKSQDCGRIPFYCFFTTWKGAREVSNGIPGVESPQDAERTKTLAELQESCVTSAALSLVNPNAPWYVRFFHADKRELKQDHNVSSMEKLGIEEAMNLKLLKQTNDYINKLIGITDSALASILSETTTSSELIERVPQGILVCDVLFALGFLDLGASTLIALRGDYECATKMFSMTLRISERLVGVGHIETTDAIFNLALYARSSGEECRGY